jgi:hypothetical protein
MANYFEISLANSIRFITEKVYEPDKYWNKHFDDDFSQNLIKNYQDKAYYSQKYTFKDNPVVQILSDFDDIAAELIALHTLEVVDTFDVLETPSTITGHTFKLYEFECDFNTEGCYILKVSYVNEDEETIIYYSEPLEIKEIHPNTIRVDYTNSKNVSSMVFNGGYIGIFRVEADIVAFKPASVDTIYIDQTYSATQLYGVAHRKFDLVLGSTLLQYAGLPDWVIDKMNRILVFDNILFDGKKYCKDEGAQFEEQTLENYPFTAQTISIVESDNKSQANFDTSFITEEMLNILRVLKYQGNTSDIAITNIFRNKTSLFHIYVYNNGAPFDLTVIEESEDDGTIIVRTIDNGWNLVEVNRPFSSLKTVYLTGLNDTLCDVFITWLRLDAPSAGSVNPCLLYTSPSPRD